MHVARPDLILLALLASLCLIGCGEESSQDPGGGPADAAPDLAAPDLDSPDAGADMEQADQPDDMPQQDMGPAQITLPPEPWDIRAKGPYTVGFRTESLTYKAAPEDNDRTIKLVMWFPSTQATGLRRAKYLGAINRPGVWTDVPPAAGGAMPVLVFSHGNGSLGEQNYFMAEHFARHGWLVIAPYHTNNTIYDNEGSINFRVAPYRPQDISATIDWLLERPAQDPLHKRADADKIALSGHSFGGFTTLATTGATFAVDPIIAACEAGSIDSRYCTIFPTPESVQLFRDGFVDPRIKVGIPQTPAGASVFLEGLAQVRIPTLLLTGGRDQSLPNDEEGDPIWAGLPALGHNIRVDLPNAGHFTFSNMCDIVPNASLVRDDGCGPDFLPVETAYDIINTYSMAFLRRHLLGDRSHDDLLDGRTNHWGDAIIFSSK